MAPLFADHLSSQYAVASLDVGVVRGTQQPVEFATTQEPGSMSVICYIHPKRITALLNNNISCFKYYVMMYICI